MDWPSEQWPGRRKAVYNWAPWCEATQPRPTSCILKLMRIMGKWMDKWMVCVRACTCACVCQVSVYTRCNVSYMKWRSWKCKHSINYYIMHLVHIRVSLSNCHSAVCVTYSSAPQHDIHVPPAIYWLPALPLQVWLPGLEQGGPPSSPSEPPWCTLLLLGNV